MINFANKGFILQEKRNITGPTAVMGHSTWGKKPLHFYVQHVGLQKEPRFLAQ